VSARTWTVNALGTGQAETIQAAVDAASDNDVIFLEAGTYMGPGNRDVDFGGKSITVISIDGPLVTTIDCEGLGRGFIFQSGETSSSILSAVTITNGTHASFGGAVYCVNSSPSIEDVIFYSNSAGVRGGAVYCDASSAVIANNEFEDNNSTYGGALWCSGTSSLNVTNNIFTLNSVTVSGGAIGCRGSSPTIDGNLFDQNRATFDGGAIHCDQSSAAVITNNTFRDNGADGNGGGIAYDNSPLSIQYNCFWGNSAVLGGGVYGSDVFGGGDITNNTFDSNGADNGGAICYTNNSRPPISNNIFANSTSGEAVYTKTTRHRRLAVVVSTTTPVVTRFRRDRSTAAATLSPIRNTAVLMAAAISSCRPIHPV
jgi:predicted outer membrane repeat protein